MILFLDAQGWNDTSEKKMAYQLILHYEKAMIEKLNKNFFSALNLVNEVIESQLDARSKHDLETIPHQLFTFGKASTYAELQIYLIRSRLGKPDIFDGKDELSDLLSDIADEFHHIKRTINSIRTTFSCSIFCLHGCPLVKRIRIRIHRNAWIKHRKWN